MIFKKDIFRKATPADKQLQQALRNILGYKPGYLQFYITAITHRSKNEDEHDNNERLEFLGDAFLGSIVGEYLFKKYPTQDEGYLTEMRSKIVSRQSLNEIAIRMGLPNLMKYNNQDKMLKRSNIFGNALEALVGAIYLDKGFKQTKRFILNNLIANYVDIEDLANTEYNFKNKLYTWVQHHNQKLDFVTMEETLEAGRKVFKIGVQIDDVIIAEATGYTKKQASQVASQRALDVLGVKHQED